MGVTSHYTKRRLKGLIQSAFSSITYKLRPLQHPLAPCVNEACNEDENEDDAFDNRKQTELTEFHSPREEKHSLNIEDQKYQSKDIVLGLELHPAISDRFDAALVSCLFDGIGLFRSQDPRDRDRADRDDQSDNKE